MNAKAVTPTVRIRRRDAGGHIAPQYAADLLAHGGGGRKRHRDGAYSAERLSRDPMAEQLAEAFVEAAISGEDDEQAVFDQFVSEEAGGPFVETTSGEEFAMGTDASNPLHAKREPFPRT